MIRPKFLKHTAISNFEILKWIKYLNIKIFKVISRDQIKHITNNHNYICNLDLAQNTGTHWVGIYYFDKNIVYFDCYGIAPIQELIDLPQQFTLKYNSTQIQNKYTTTCGYFSIYFINEIIFKSFINVIKPFTNNTNYNEQFIQNYFNNI